MDPIDVAQAFGVRFLIVALAFYVAYLGLVANLRGNSKHGDIEKWDTLLAQIFGFFEPTTVDTEKARPCTAICARFSKVEEDKSLERLRRARTLYARASRRFGNYRKRPVAVGALCFLLSMVGAALLILPMFSVGGAPLPLRDCATYTLLVIGLFAAFCLYRHVDDFDTLKELAQRRLPAP